MNIQTHQKIKERLKDNTTVLLEVEQDGKSYRLIQTLSLVARAK